MKKGFTLIETLAVIVILALILLLAVPIMNNKTSSAKKEIFINSARSIARSLEYKSTDLDDFYSAKLSKLDLDISKDDYDLSKSIAHIENGDITVNLVGKGKFEGLYVCNVKSNSKDVVIQSTPCGVVSCTYEGELVQGAEYINGQYTYRYMQEATSSSWSNISTDGWGVKLTDKASSDPVTTALCSTINDKPIVSMSYMFYQSKATQIDLSSFDTSNVTNMGFMFSATEAKKLDLGNFDTSKVTNMRSMFGTSSAKKLDLSGFDTSNVTDMLAMFRYSLATDINLRGFNTSKITNMSNMFTHAQATDLDLSSFDTSNVTKMTSMFVATNLTTLDLSSFDTSSVSNMSGMFLGSAITSGYAKTQADADRLNAVTDHPSDNIFVVKP